MSDSKKKTKEAAVQPTWGMLGGDDNLVTIRGASVAIKALTLKQRLEVGEKLSAIEVDLDGVSKIYKQLGEVITSITFPMKSPMAVWNDKPVVEVLENLTDLSIIPELIGAIVSANQLTEGQAKN